MLKPFVSSAGFFGGIRCARQPLEGLMRRYLRVLIAMIPTVAAALAPAAAQDKPRYGGELLFRVPSEPPSYDAHREETFGVMHPMAPHYNTLLRVDPNDKTGTKPVGDLAESWTASKDGRTYTFKPRRGGRRAGAVRRRRSRAGARPVHRRVPPEVAFGLVPGLGGVTVELDLQGRHPGQGHAVVRDERDGHRSIPLRGAPEGLALGRQEEPELLGQGQALPGRLPGDFHQGFRRPGGRGPGRAGAHPVPGILARRARQPRGGAGPEDHRPGEPVGRGPPGGHQPREEAVRRQAGGARAG